MVGPRGFEPPTYWPQNNPRRESVGVREHRSIGEWPTKTRLYRVFCVVARDAIGVREFTLVPDSQARF